MKTITIDDAGNIEIVGTLFDNDKINIGLSIFDQDETDNDGQIVFYTGIYEEELV